jgi:fatty acid desaturase
MESGVTRRDYSLTGRDAARAVETGLADADWYKTDVPRAEMKKLVKRSDGPAIRDTIVWLGLLVGSGGGGISFWSTWWCVPFFLVYGVLYGSASDSRWHECGHGTAFKTQWMNRAVYQIASFMIMRNPVTWRWSHARHHTDTEIVGRDPELNLMRPPDLLRAAGNFIGIFDVFWLAIPEMLRNASGRLSASEKVFIPQAQHKNVILAARAWRDTSSRGLSITLRSFLPLMLVGLPRLYGCWHMVMAGLLQHGGLADNVTDHRLNSRTVYMNPISRFIYWNMNYHVEHHMFPMVPYHALPRLHETIKQDLPTPNPSILHAFKEIIPAFVHQLRYEDYFIKRELPPTARPYRQHARRRAIDASTPA